MVDLRVSGIDLSLNGTAIVTIDYSANEIKKDVRIWFFTKKNRLAGDFPEDSFLMSKNLDSVYRLKYIYEHIKSVLENDSPDAIAMEDYSFSSRGMQFSIGELGGIIKMMIADELKIPLRLYKPTQIKKFVTGKGTSPKSIMLTSVYKKFGEDFTKYDSSADDIADAYSIARMMLLEMRLRSGEKVKINRIEEQLFKDKNGYCKKPFLLIG